ncbi:MAG: hypothetical protein QW223_06555 [Candidatus Caldarchaeum sp.]
MINVKYLSNELVIETTREEPKMHNPADGLLRDPKGKLYKRKKNVYHLRIRLSSNEKFYNLVGFTIERKRKRPEEIFEDGKTPASLNHQIFSIQVEPIPN